MILYKKLAKYKIFPNLHSPVDGRKSLIDRSIDRPASTDKAERKILGPVDGRIRHERPTYQPVSIDRLSREAKFSARSMDPVDG